MHDGMKLKPDNFGKTFDIFFKKTLNFSWKKIVV